MTATKATPVGVGSGYRDLDKLREIIAAWPWPGVDPDAILKLPVYETIPGAGELGDICLVWEGNELNCYVWNSYYNEWVSLINPIVWKREPMPARSWTPPSAWAPTSGDLNNIQYMSFATAPGAAQFLGRLWNCPADWRDANTEMIFRIFWIRSVAGGGDVRISVHYKVIDEGSAVDWTGEIDQGVTIDIDAASTDTLYQDDLTLNDAVVANMAPGKSLMIRFHRDTGHADDTYAQPWLFVGNQILYQTVYPGTRLSSP